MNKDIAIAEEVQVLIVDEEDQLFARLGSTLHSIGMNPAVAGTYRVPEVTMGFGSDMIDLGKRLYGRWNKEAYDLVCGGGEGVKTERQKLLDAVGVGQPAFGAAIASLLIGTFGLAPPLAVLVAAVIVKRVVVPAGEVLCETWAESMAG